MVGYAQTEWLKKRGVIIFHNPVGWPGFMQLRSVGAGPTGELAEVGTGPLPILMGLQHSVVAGFWKNESKAARSLKSWAEQCAQSLHRILLINAIHEVPPPTSFRGEE